MPRKVAIFDVDGTIFRSSLIIHITEEMISRGIFPRQARTEYKGAFNKWLERLGDYEKYIEAVVASFMKHMRGMPYAQFAEITDEVVARERNKLYRFTRDLIKDLKKKKYFLLAISQSPKHALDVFLEDLGFDKVYGRIYEIGPQDKMTGEIQDLHLIANKANIVRRAVEKNNLTLKGSIGVGDTEGDIPMLELVERAIAFNPNQKLYKYAKRMGWQIVVERKDVIYQL